MGTGSGSGLPENNIIWQETMTQPFLDIFLRLLQTSTELLYICGTTCMIIHCYNT